MAVDERVQRHYETVDEDERLWEEGRGELIRLRTWDIFARFLPPAGVVLDVGGGPGAHSAHLAGLGYQVVLIEPLAHHVEQAAARSRQRPGGPGFGVIRSDAGRLPLDDATVDAVLLMGPLYHLVERHERLAALGEARRVLRPGGLLLAEAITRHAWLLDATSKGLLDRPGIWETFACNLDTGLAQDPASMSQGGFWAYFHSPAELAQELTDAGFADMDLVAVEGFGWLLGDLGDRLAEPDLLLDALRLTEREPSMLGVSAHVMGVASRPSESASLSRMDLNHLDLRVRDAAACRDFYESHFGFRLAFEADWGYFVRNDEGFLLALVPTESHQALPDGFHIGFGVADAEAVMTLHRELAAAGARTADVRDFRPDEEYVTFRCWDPDGTEVEVFWEPS